MDLLALAIAGPVLTGHGLRRFARDHALPVATLSAAFHRVEAELATALVTRIGSDLTPTIEGQRLTPVLQELSRLAHDIAPEGRMPLAISLEALARLVTISQAGSIRAAARLVGLGQPQLTRQMANLEAKLGLKLLERGRTGASLTADGRRIAILSERIAGLWQEISRQSDSRFRQRSRAIRIGSVLPLGPQSNVAGLLATLAAGWAKAHPHQPLSIAPMLAEDLLSALRRGSLDAALIDVQAIPDDLEAYSLTRTPLALIARLDEGQRTIRTCLENTVLVLPSARTGLRLQAELWLETALGKADAGQVPIMEIDSIPVILRLITEHGFSSILPMSSLDSEREGLTALQCDAAPPIPLWLAFARGREDQALRRSLRAVLLQEK